ncbi:MAG TPA: 7-carboxy-7-deazaguanine synthase QueE [Moraxellaceae bacterium]|nr:7-carboxy-7-deazaguanine synthase QueE [Moraxellaceae bacterium]HQV41261.1 7-carboxy-7-deazaguanine synthase QueE [Moraxellaceae bacterium]
MTELRISEIFHSLQGEARTVGRPTVFIRLTGCPLRCVWCDTPYAFSGGSIMTLDTVLETVALHGAKHICVTGGEPLAQPECLTLLTALCDSGMEVSLETSGAMDVSKVDPRVSKVMDLKAPDSGEAHRNLYENIPHLTQHDQVKFVIASHKDYEWVRFKCDEYQLVERVGDVLFSPVHGALEPRQLAEWILADRLHVRMQVQLHKYLWNNEPGH